MKIDCVLTAAQVIDPGQGLSGRYSIGIHQGRIYGLYADDEMLPAAQVCHDLQDALVSPGWIDLHVHAYPAATRLGMAADSLGIRQGVTTVVDAGSSGARVWPAFRQDAVDTQQTRVLAWLNLAPHGLTAGEQELAGLAWQDLTATAACCREDAAIRGIKLRLSASVIGENGLEPLKAARRLSDQTGLPLFVHVGNAPPLLTDILPYLQQGDVITHAFHGKPGGILAADGQVLTAVREALQRGVCLDIGHGSSSFSFTVLEAALADGVWPDTISTDLYVDNYQGPVYSLAATIEKCLAVGMPLAAAVARVTSRPAEILSCPELGRIRAGLPADLTVFRVRPQAGSGIDAQGIRRTLPYAVTVEQTIKAGRIWEIS